MVRYRGGQHVEHGCYVNWSNWEFESIGAGGGVLPGSDKNYYSKVSLPVILFAGPMMGLAYVITVSFSAWIIISRMLALIAYRLIRPVKTTSSSQTRSSD